MNHIDNDSHVQEWLKQPIENWRFEVEFRLPLLDHLLTAMTTPAGLKDKVIFIGSALSNERERLGGYFILYRNGNVIRHNGVFQQLPVQTVIIELSESNLKSLAVLNKQIAARERSSADFNAFEPWSVTGYIQSDPNRLVRLMLKNNGTFLSPRL